MYISLCRKSYDYIQRYHEWAGVKSRKRSARKNSTYHHPNSKPNNKVGLKDGEL